MVTVECLGIPLDKIVDAYREALRYALDALIDPHLSPVKRQACQEMVKSASWLLAPLWDLQQYAEEFPRNGVRQ